MEPENRRMVTHFCDTIGQAVQGRKISIEPPSGQKSGLGPGASIRLFIQSRHWFERAGAGRS
jgi:hypothetical protein